MKKSTMEELDIIFNDGLYSVDVVSGNIINNFTGEYKKYHKDKRSGKLRVGLRVPNTYYINRKGVRIPKVKVYDVGCVMAYFIGLFDGIKNPEKYVVIYKNDDPSLNNLKLESKVNHFKYLYKKGVLCNLPKENKMKRIRSKDQVNLVRELYLDGYGIRPIGKMLNISKSRVSDICHNKTYYNPIYEILLNEKRAS